MILTILINLIAIFIYLYILWYKLKEDYSATLIFSGGFTIAFFIILMNIVSFRFFPRYWFWASVMGFLIGTSFSIYRYKFSFYEYVDSVIISLHPWLGLIFLDRLASFQNFSIFILFSQVLFSGILYLILDSHYKSFTWYKSGRVGFSGFAVFGIFFLVRSIIALGFEDMISFIGINDAILSGVISFISFLFLYNLSKSKY